jgi:hypothetical protein
MQAEQHFCYDRDQREWGGGEAREMAAAQIATWTRNALRMK